MKWYSVDLPQATDQEKQIVKHFRRYLYKNFNIDNIDSMGYYSNVLLRVFTDEHGAKRRINTCKKFIKHVIDWMLTTLKKECYKHGIQYYFNLS